MSDVETRNPWQLHPVRGRKVWHDEIVTPLLKPRELVAMGFRAVRARRPIIVTPTLRGGPQIVAHRGASFHDPEHTLDAYARAIEIGAGGLECDVRLTADGHLVCVHDRKLTRTSNGRGVVGAMTLAELEAFDWGSWKERLHPDGSQAETTHSPLLRFDQLLDLVEGAGRRVDLAVETKHPTRHHGHVEIALARELRERGLDVPQANRPNVRMMSFSLNAVQRMHTLTPNLPLAWLREGVVPIKMQGGALPEHVSIAAISVGMLARNPDLVAAQHSQGHEVHVWTVDEDDDILRCFENGVDAIITNKPAHVMAALEAWQ